MRIPSQFNDSSLYRTRSGAESQKRRSVVPPNGTLRRLVRLAVALALVVVVMRQARQPGLYRVFFGGGDESASIREGWEQIPPSIEVSRPARLVAVSDQQSSDSTTVQWRGASEWGQRMDLPLQRDWIETLMNLSQYAGPTSQDDEDIGESSFDWIGVTEQQILASIEIIPRTSSEDTSAEKVIQQLNQLAALSKQGNLSIRDVPKVDWWAEPLLRGLDQAALSRVADGTFWTSEDSDAFYLQLARVDQLDETGASTTGTLPLLQQPDVYRGQVLRVVGSLQLANPRDAKPNRAGIKRYWKLWVVPKDGGVRPTILVVPTIPASIRALLRKDGTVDSESPSGNTGEIIAVGRFLKRLPYRSTVGADIAPVVVGRITAVRSIPSIQSTTKSSGSGSDNRHRSTFFSGSAAWGILLAIAGGIAAAAILMYRATRDAKRTRRVRQAGLERSGFDASILENSVGANVFDGEE